MRLRRMTKHVMAQNWLAVALDFLIVVVGVMLALWTSQWAAERSARQSAAIAAEAMDADLMAMAQGTMRRFTTNPCLVEAIGRLDASVSVGDGEAFVAPVSGRVTEIEDSVFQDYYPVGLWNYPTQAFDRAVAIGAFDHMEAQRASDYGRAYQWVGALAEANSAEEILRSRLSVVEMIDTMDAPTRLAIRRDLAELDGWNQAMLNAGRFLFDTMHSLGIEPDAEDHAQWLFYNERARAVRGDCVIDLPLDFSGEFVGKGWSNETGESDSAAAAEPEA